MADLVFIGVIVAFFGLALLLVRACERIIGSDQPVTTPAATAPTSTLTGR